jgi:cytochrome P450
MVFAGLDTTTSALSRCVYLLAKNPHAQARLRSEIRGAVRSIPQNGSSILEHENPLLDLTYDALMNLPFLDSVVKETLRLYPSLPHMARKYVSRRFQESDLLKYFGRATKATKLPLQYPVRSSSGAETSAIAMPENSVVIISILTANRNRTIWGDDANEWKPERWLSPLVGPGTEDPRDSTKVLPSGLSAPILGVKDGTRYPGVYSNMSVFTSWAIVVR